MTPVGRLRNITHWKRANAGNFIIDVIENGYKLPLKVIPEKAF
jgi:hypothetical protein